ncbi:exopolysaccharide biosynthesis polyprenyl glycosylphosphotransferase [Aquimarina sp. AD10]|uniref:exopolysaccharide biosynthesis polyprenyl glycosylphosphotransferase n=1 Tax=Aquimarina sp. AD10 TaxID=1714849 RepID=UPI000E4CED69|nr:exopolysaccharide biosynthesis polyprenyl glycosylphosphotransferase [Aquimarina sp. AD10]AXT61821.1 exopolysaccharide biosynthesis polyprenyl glycosylphosphotransferase [Aquimarina sp. AD10]RKN02619.1 exopolysaccharide biosynthesis polyprenyl glycosylphosphotransferase [Aquimarina sp. AD10]
MNRVFTLNVVERKLFLFIGDLTIVFFYLYLLTDRTLRGTFDQDRHGLTIYIMGVVLFSIIAYVIDIYNLERASKPISIFRLSLVVGVLYSFALFFLTVLLINTTVSRPYLIVFLALMPFSLTAWRLICSNFFISQPFLKNAIFIFENSFEDEKLENINDIEGIKNSNGYKVKLSISTCHDTFSKNPKRLNKAMDKVDTVIIRIKDYQNMPFEVENFLTKSMYFGKEVFTFTSFYESTYEALPLNLLGNNFYEVLHLKNKRSHYIQKLFTKLVDIILCLFVGLIFFSVVPFVVLLNLFFNRGPLFYIQKRIGKKGREFNIYKFRSMVVDAEKSGAKMATNNDARITPFGKILRMFRIDELPQIISVIKGDMSFIGPRPERKVFVDQLDKMNPFYSVRHVIKPGITGWAQVKYKYGENLEDSMKKLEYDLYYIKNRSVTLDIRILFKTITTILFSRGV